MRHINLKDCAVRDSILAKKFDLCHIPGDVIPSDVFTKEMRDASRFCTGQIWRSNGGATTGR